jgi:hypothetical protein
MQSGFWNECDRTPDFQWVPLDGLVEDAGEHEGRWAGRNPVDILLVIVVILLRFLR